MALCDAWGDFVRWVDQVGESRDVAALVNPPTTRVVSARYGSDEKSAQDVTALIAYYYAHDKHLTVGSLHRMMSRHQIAADAAGSPIMRLVFMRDGILFESHFADAVELLTGTELVDDSVCIASLPGIPLDQANQMQVVAI